MGYLKEETIKKEGDITLFKRLSAYLIPYKKEVVLLIFLLFFIAFLNLVGPYLIKVAIDGPIKNKDVSGLRIIALLFFSSILASAVGMFFQMFLAQKVGQGIMHRLRTEIFSHIQNKNITLFHKSRVGGLITRIVGDVDVLTEMFSYGMVSIFSNLLMVVGIVVVLLCINPKFAIATFIVIPPLIPLSLLFRNRVRGCFRDIRSKISGINSFLQEHVVGIEVTKLFCREEINDEKFDELNEDYLSTYLRTVFYYSMFFPVMEIVGTLTLAIILWYGGGEVFKGKVTFGEMVAFIEYAQKFFRPVKDLIERYNILQSGMAAAERIFEVLDNEDDKDNIDKGESFSEEIETIKFESVNFSYRPDQPVLKNISCSINKGEKIAIVGPTGAGKTTFIHLLCRFYDPISGSIKVNGKDVLSLKKKSVRSRFGLVLQDPFLFRGSLKKNITLGSDSVDDEHISKALSITGVDKVAAKLSGGTDGIISERGENISIGERQLVSFAQALVYDPEILILDEATAHIDSQSEKMIKGAMEEMGKDRTMITIAHRFSTILGADRILVFWKGELVEQGTHKHLMETGEIYRKLYKLQYSKDEVEHM